ncbi:hypothetical protein IRT45_14165 [Nocardia sp. BSTN01]|uniref:hypothetical protein n=1 Tax=Nocardia sp. BSTN01 TaxID=2783665 RepID=UPI00189057B2|nr:hypothetical protein [Nocardia sp. BSTN01]MBF4998297.1 hypothetical protein [Nocardia sp. BSTN01]
MSFPTFPRPDRLGDVLSASARRIRARYHLTPAERHNLRSAHIPHAVVTASLGGHTYHR